MTVVFVTRTGLSIHRSVIEIVHLIGAPDSYVAQQFQAQSLRLGVVGGVVGTIQAAATLLGADHLLHVTSSLRFASGNATLGGDPSGLALNRRRQAAAVAMGVLGGCCHLPLRSLP